MTLNKVYLFVEKKKIENKRKENIEKVYTHIEQKSALHVKARQTPYHCSKVNRFSVPDEFVRWEVRNHYLFDGR